MPPNYDRCFSDGLGWNGHLNLCGGLDFCGGLVYNLSGRSLEPLGLDNGGGRPDNNGEDDIRDVREAGGRVLRLCNFLIKVFNVAL